MVAVRVLAKFALQRVLLLPFELSLSFFLVLPDGTLYALDCFGLQGGGLSITGTATLTNSNVYLNEASKHVRSLFEPSVTGVPPSPLWNVTHSVFLPYIRGTATLTNTNVYSNTASYVCFPSALA